MQAIGVQRIGRVVGGHHKRHAMIKQGLQQVVQNHRIRDIGDMKFIKTNQPVALRNLLGHDQQGIFYVFLLVQCMVYLAHELMKMYACLALHWHDSMKTIHQK